MTNAKNAWSSLKDHPLFIVITCCAATAGATAAVYQNVIMPNNAKIQEAEIVDLKKQIASMPANAGALAAREATISSLQKQVAELRQKVVDLSKDNSFSSQDPYPKTLGMVRIGDLLSKVEETYPGKVKQDDADNPYVSVDVDDFFFSTITYYYDETRKPYRITHLLFLPHRLVYITGLRNGASSPEDAMALLRMQMVSAFGEGKRVKRSTVWTVRGVKLTLDDRGLLHLEKA